MTDTKPTQEGLNEQEYEEYARLCATLMVEFSGILHPEEVADLKRFDSMSDYSYTYIRNALILNKNENAQLLFMTVNYADHRHSSFYKQIYGYARLNNNFGKVLLRPEKPIDRVIGFLNPVEARLTHDRKFDRSFHILASNTYALKEHMTSEFRQAISEIETPEFFIEINETELLIGDRKPWNIDTARDFAAFLLKLSSL